MRLVFLGTGGGGNPPIGIDRDAAGIIDRTSNALVVQPNYPEPPTLLIDAAPDIRMQWAAWREAPLQPDAMVLTHEHQDHLLGMGEFRRCVNRMPVYATPRTLDHLARFGELMFASDPTLNLTPHALPERGEATIAGVTVETVQLHHLVPVTGVIIRHGGKTFAHLSDTGPLVEPDVRAAIAGCDVLAVNTAFLHDTPQDDGPMAYAYQHHISIPAAIRLAQEVGAKKLALLHFSHTTPERELQRIAAENPSVLIPKDGEALDL